MKYLLFTPLFFFLVGCAAENHTYLPDFETLNTAEQVHSCTSIFPKGEWQFVHSIEFSRRGGAGTTVVGITTLSMDMIRSALVTVEGFTLFEAYFYKNNSLRVVRAVPPFDSPGFAEGMMADVHAIFRLPSAESILEGRIQEGANGCRYTGTRGQVIDVMPNKDDCWQITSYTPGRIMDRNITGRSCIEKGSTRIPEYLELQTYGTTGYTLKMTLLRVDKLQ